MIERTDREEKASPVDIICPPGYYAFSSPFVSQFLAFNVKRKFGRLKVASEAMMSSTEDSTEDSYEEYYNVKQLAKLIARDPRLGDELESQVVTRLVQFLEHKEFNITYYAAVILSYIVSSKHGSVVKDETIPYLLNLIPSPDTFVQNQALITLIEIANAYPDSCDTMIKNGVLELLESLFTNKENIEALLERAGELLTTLCRMKQQLPSDMMIKVVRIISTAIVNDSKLVLIQICLLISILSDRRLVEIGFEVIRLLDLINHREYYIVISALRTIGNYVRWGDDEDIQFMIKQALLPRLAKLLCHEYTIVRKEACWIISNIVVVANNLRIQEVIELDWIDTLVRLVRTDEFEVKEVAERAISNVVSGSDKKQLLALLHCTKILQLDNIRACMASGATADHTSVSAEYAGRFEKITKKKNSRRCKKKTQKHPPSVPRKLT